MDAPEALAVVAAGVAGWAVGRRRGDADRAREAGSREPLRERVERSGRDIARQMGTAITAGGARAVAYTAKGVTEAGNAVAIGAGRTAGAVESARTGVSALLHRGKPGENDRTSRDEQPVRAEHAPTEQAAPDADLAPDSDAGEITPGPAPATA